MLISYDKINFMTIEDKWLKEIEIIQWFFSHKRLFKKIILFSLVGFNIIVWSIFIYHFIFYIIYTPKYRAMLKELTIERIDIVSYHQKNAPQGVELKDPVAILIEQKANQWRYNFVVQAINPNSIWFVKNIIYEFVWQDGRVHGQEMFFLPKESKYLFALGVLTSAPVVNLRVEINKVNWLRKRPEHQERLKILDGLSFRVTKFTPSWQQDDKIFPASVQFEIQNYSAYNFRQIEMLIAVYQGAKIVDFETISIKNLRRQEKRLIDLNLSLKINFASEIVLVPQINILDPNVFGSP